MRMHVCNIAVIDELSKASLDIIDVTVPSSLSVSLGRVSMA